MANFNNLFFALLRFSLGIDRNFTFRPTADEWTLLYEQACRLSLAGVMYEGVSQLPEDYFEPASSGETDSQAYMPQQLATQWAYDAEMIAGLNDLQNRKAAQLTARFEQRGRHTVILKGQANALLYPNPLSRQPGDIDIYVDGGRERVGAMLNSLGMGEDAEDNMTHHFRIPPDENGIEVEVHYMPGSGNLNVTTNRRLQAYLMQLLANGAGMCDAGFRVPSSAFALTMQLAHIIRHAVQDGVGLRQVIDYYLLLRSSTGDDRHQLAGRLKELGLHRDVAAALMWVLAETLHLPEEQMITPPDRRRGKWLLDHMLGGANFEWYTMPRYGAWQRFATGRRKALGLIWFCPKEAHRMVRQEMQYLWTLFVKIPQRIKYRKLSLNELQLEKNENKRRIHAAPDR